MLPHLQVVQGKNWLGRAPKREHRNGFLTVSNLSRLGLRIKVTELDVNRTSSMPRSVLHYLKDKGQYFGLEISLY